MPNTEKSEMLTVYDKDLNPIGERTRADVHANGLLHQTIRLWTIQGDTIWFQQRSMNKALFPGRLDLSATGHIDPGEKPEAAVLRETAEEIGLGLSTDDLKSLKGIPFPFTRPDGKLDNEFANVFLYTPSETPCFKTSDEVAGLASVSVRDYNKLLRTGEPIDAVTYRCDPDGKRPPLRTGVKTCGVNDFCCLNPQEWELIQAAIEPPAKVKDRGLGKVGEIAASFARQPAYEDPQLD